MKGPGILLLLAIFSACDQKGVDNGFISPDSVDSDKKVGVFRGKYNDVRGIEHTNAGKFIKGVNYTLVDFVFQVTCVNVRKYRAWYLNVLLEVLMNRQSLAYRKCRSNFLE